MKRVTFIVFHQVYDARRSARRVATARTAQRSVLAAIILRVMRPVADVSVRLGGPALTVPRLARQERMEPDARSYVLNRLMVSQLELKIHT